MTSSDHRSGTLTAVATWHGGWLCSVQAGGFRLTVDEPPEAGATGRGPMPTDLLLASSWPTRRRSPEPRPPSQLLRDKSRIPAPDA